MFSFRGAELDLLNNDGLTPLMKAASWGQAKAVNSLMFLRAKYTITDIDDHSAIWHAANENNEEVLKVNAHAYVHTCTNTVTHTHTHIALHCI